jgi:hypothetical protein
MLSALTAIVGSQVLLFALLIGTVALDRRVGNT